jgi:hypothetical protein
MAGMGDVGGAPLKYADFALTQANQILDASAATISAVLTPGKCDFESKLGKKEVTTLDPETVKTFKAMKIGLKKDTVHSFRGAVVVKGKFSMASDSALTETGGVALGVASGVKDEAAGVQKARAEAGPKPQTEAAAKRASAETIALDRAKAIYMRKREFLFKESEPYLKAKELSDKLKQPKNAAKLAKWKADHSPYSSPSAKIIDEFGKELQKTLDDITLKRSKTLPNTIDTWTHLAAVAQTEELKKTLTSLKKPDMVWPYVVDYEVWSVDPDDAKVRLELMGERITQAYCEDMRKLHNTLMSEGTRFSSTLEAIKAEVMEAEKERNEAVALKKRAEARKIDHDIEAADKAIETANLKHRNSSSKLEKFQLADKALDKAEKDIDALPDKPKKSFLEQYNDDVAAVDKMCADAGFDLGLNVKSQMASLLKAHDTKQKQLTTQAQKLGAEWGNLRFIRKFKVRAATTWGSFNASLGTATKGEVTVDASISGDTIVAIFNGGSVVNPKIKNIVWGDAIAGEIKFGPDGAVGGTGPVGDFFMSHQ